MPYCLKSYNRDIVYIFLSWNVEVFFFEFDAVPRLQHGKNQWSRCRVISLSPMNNSNTHALFSLDQISFNIYIR